MLAPHEMLAVAIEEARIGLAEGGIPIGAAIFRPDGTLLGSGHNRRVQHHDPSAHGETDAFRNAGRQRSYRDLIMVTTLAPCWYCTGLIRQFGFKTVIIGESQTFEGGIHWLRDNGFEVRDLASRECIGLLGGYIHLHPNIWNEDIGEDMDRPVTKAHRGPGTFISYCRDDLDFVDKLAKDLTTRGTSIWLDRIQIRAGQAWDKAVENALGHCPQLMVVLSPAAVASDNVLNEVAFALDEGKPVIPVLYQDCQIPFRLRRLHRADFRSNYTAGISDLMRALDMLM